MGNMIALLLAAGSAAPKSELPLGTYVNANALMHLERRSG